MKEVNLGGKVFQVCDQVAEQVKDHKNGKFFSVSDDGELVVIIDWSVANEHAVHIFFRDEYQNQIRCFFNAEEVVGLLGVRRNRQQIWIVIIDKKDKKHLIEFEIKGGWE